MLRMSCTVALVTYYVIDMTIYFITNDWAFVLCPYHVTKVAKYLSE